MKKFKIISAAFLIVMAGGYSVYQILELTQVQNAPTKPEAGMEADLAEMAAAVEIYEPSYEGSSLAGSYLSGRAAQRYHDWKTAGRYMDYVLEDNPDDPALLKRAAVLAAGAGDMDRAFGFAREIIEDHEPDNALSRMFLAAESLKTQDYNAAVEHIRAMPEGGVSNFIMPLLYSWASASLGEYDVEGLKTNNIHFYHAILISDFMGKKENVGEMLGQLLTSGELDLQTLERVADIYAHIGERDNALALYQKALVIDPENALLHKKMDTLKAGEHADIFVRVKTPEQGVAEAFFDMAQLLTHEYSDESARVFAHLAVYIDPGLTRGTFLLAEIAARNERFDEAIALYENVQPSDEGYLEAQRQAADILNEEGRSAEAIAALEGLVDQYGDLESLIQIGNIYRMDEQFSQAVKAYDEAFDKIGSNDSQEYWYLHYVRGMSHEQNGAWDKAEADLQQALAFQPDHPYVLNYLGYAWADQGKNLDVALEMIERASTLRPGDGYITDSLGWVYYRMGRFEEAVPYLERAVELMPYDPTINDHLGDAYWTVGRKLEAEFQWQRARNHTEDEEMIAAIEKKLLNGLDAEVTESQTGDARLGEPDLNKTAQEALGRGSGADAVTIQ